MPRGQTDNQAYASGDLDGMLDLVDPELEWTYLDPALEHPTPQVYSVFTVRAGRIVALSDFRDRHEALQAAGIRP